MHIFVPNILNMAELEFYTDPSAMTPLFPEDTKNALGELAITLMKKASALSGALNPTTRESLVRLIEPMNSYYSNLIEGHNTHPIDIEKALKKDYSKEPKKKSLQLESVAHIHVQELMKEKLKHPDSHIGNADFIKWLHAEFYKKMPEEYQYSKTLTDKKIKIVPGKFRTGEVRVGDHIAPAAAAVESFMKMFVENYDPGKITDPVKRIIAAAASHHRIAWIHPFLDGNGRVARLYTEAYFIAEKIDGNGLWSISRGLSIHNKKYYDALHNADLQRWNDYDGRGNLSNKGLVAFCTFMLETAIDQIEFMSTLLDIDNALERIKSYVSIMVSRQELRPEAAYVLETAFLKGKIARGEIERLTGKSENTARKIMNELMMKDLLISKSDDTKTPLYINFPVKVAPYLFPKLYPEAIEASLVSNIAT